MTIEEIFNSFNKLKVLIIGDVMLDSYIWGAVERISPEAPVPVVLVRKRDYRLGGAANVALNIQSLGAKPILCALVGKDEAGKKLMECMRALSITDEGIVFSDSRPTTEKIRVIASHQHVVRVDEESDRLADSEEEKKLLERISALIIQADVVIFEDYDKGVITSGLIEKTVALASQKGIPTVVDPKKRNFLNYKNVSLFKPNLKELREGLKVDIDSASQSQIANAIETLKQKLNVNGVMVTLSEHGVYIDFQNQKLKLPAHKRKIADVSGAGDTVVSIAALCAALKLDPKQIASLSNLGGGLVCQYVGVVPVDKKELQDEASKSLI
jgi:rfaE bifunctional protein kinase chain/domain